MPVRKGDVFFIPAGMLHGIGKGITVAEVQQSSNITYRVYDYHRVDAQQKQRPLHIEKASQVLGFLPSLQGHGPMGPKICGEGYERTLLIRCPYFTVYRYEICSKMDCPKAEQEQSLLVLEGEGILTTSHQEMNLKKGDSIYLPAGTNSYTLTGNMQILLSEVEV